MCLFFDGLIFELTLWMLAGGGSRLNEGVLICFGFSGAVIRSVICLKVF